MPDENDARVDEIDDEMPDEGVAPCGDIFETPATYVTDADADIVGDAAGG